MQSVDSQHNQLRLLTLRYQVQEVAFLPTSARRGRGIRTA
jgi:hypothetical protein